MSLKNKSHHRYKGWIASKRGLLVTASFTILNSVAQANVMAMNDHDFEASAHLMPAKHAHTMDDSKSAEKLSEQIPATIVREFAEFAYSVNKKEGWAPEDKTIYNKLINDGWKMDPFNGTTGAADHQVESVSGFIAFKGHHVVIATRGTEMTNWDDWKTNCRFSRSPILRMFSSEETKKISSVTGDLFGVEGEIANGFLQTHLSSWDSIRHSIAKRAEHLRVLPRDLYYTVTGHSLGGAKAQLNALRLLTDPTLGIGVRKLESSFIVDVDPAMGSFYSVAEYSKPENPGNVEAIVFGSPHVFDTTAAEQVDKILGDAIFRVENNDQKLFAADIGDIVPSLPPAFLGFTHVGKRIGDKEANGFLFARHMMNYISKEATDEVDALRGVGLFPPRVDLSKAADMHSNAAAPAA